MHSWILGLLTLLLLCACGNDDMKKYSRLEDLRVLAISADTPEINAPGVVNLTPFLSYTNGGDTTLNISYEACLDPGISFGAKISCDSYDDTAKISGSSNFDTSTIGSANFYTGPMSSIPISVPALFFIALADFDTSIQFNGVDLLVIFTITDQNDRSQTLKMVKRISLTTRASLNSNPTITDMVANNSSITSFPTSEVTLDLSGTSDPETYDFQGANTLESLTETMTVSWFSNVGEFKYSRTDRNEGVRFDPESKTEGVIVGVYRDNRGGVAVIRKVN